MQSWILYSGLEVWLDFSASRNRNETTMDMQVQE